MGRRPDTYTLRKRAKEMRGDMPPAERILWSKLSRKQVAGVRFSRQIVVGNFIADFCARKHRLIVEVDGDSHDHGQDLRRDAVLRSLSYRTLRFTNDDIHENLYAALETIERALDGPPLPLPEGRGKNRG